MLKSIDYRDGSLVKAGTTLFVIEPAPYQAQLQQAEGGLAAAQAQLAQTQAEFQRQATLVRQSFTSRSTYDQAKATFASNQASVQTQTAALALARINLGYTRVTAPFDGIVMQHQVSVGQFVGSGSPTKLATIVQLSPIYVTFNVSEQTVLRLRAAARKISLKPEDLRNIPVEVGLMTEAGYPHNGRLDYIAPQLDSQTGTLAGSDSV